MNGKPQNQCLATTVTLSLINESQEVSTGHRLIKRRRNRESICYHRSEKRTSFHTLTWKSGIYLSCMSNRSFARRPQCGLMEHNELTLFILGWLPHNSRIEIKCLKYFNLANCPHAKQLIRSSQDVRSPVYSQPHEETINCNVWIVCFNSSWQVRRRAWKGSVLQPASYLARWGRPVKSWPAASSGWNMCRTPHQTHQPVWENTQLLIGLRKDRFLPLWLD